MDRSDLTAFLAGERPDDVAFFLADDVLSSPESLAEYAVEGGVLLVVDGERGRNLFSELTGTDAMGFAQTAMGRTGSIDDDLTGGDCPDGPGDAHEVRIIFAFAEEQNDEVGGIYAEGDVIHAYAHCACGAAYSDRWIVGEE
ncbi:MAG: DUF5807 family protein [Halobacteriales archaeon]|nr:DUF5807 family protein [Halobacteriales archaeon]